MIDIPLGKALVAEENENSCVGCICFTGFYGCLIEHGLDCYPDERKDGKNVIFKLVDWREEKK